MALFDGHDVIKARRRAIRSSIPVGRGVRAGYVAFGQKYRTSALVDSTRPSHSLDEGAGQQKAAIRPVEDVKETISIGMQDELPILAAELRVHKNDGRVGIPIVGIVRSELVIPFHFAGGRIQRKEAIGKQVIAAAFAIV